MPLIMSNLTKWSKLGLEQDCYAKLADLMCISCAPNTNNFVLSTGNSILIRICRTLCDSLYSVCKGDLAKIPSMPLGTGSGSEFCSNLFTEDPRMVVSESGCFTGLPVAQIEQSQCLPTAGGNNSTNAEAGSDSSSTVEGLVGTLVVLVSVLLLVSCLSLLLATGAAWFVWNRRDKVVELDSDDGEDPDDIPMEELTRSKGRAPVKLYRSDSGGIPVHIKSKDEEEELEA